MMSWPFCVIERPYMVWGERITEDNAEFLQRIDGDLYFRMAHSIINGTDALEDRDSESTDDQERKDVSSLSRLLWHHGIETLVMLLGAYMQAPAVAHAYVLKCKTEDATKIGELLLNEEAPPYHHLQGAEFTLENLLRGIFRPAGWADLDELTDRLTGALRSMLIDFTSEKHRWEYNSIKHGLRASHGGFALAVGLQSAPGIPAPPETMQMVGQSRDSSFFNVAKPLANATKSEGKRHFHTERVGVTWSLEKVLIELQILSVLIHNVASAIRVASGSSPDSVTYNRLVDDGDLWTSYDSVQQSPIPTFSMSIVPEAKRGKLPSEKEIFASYKRRTNDDAANG